MLESGSSHAGQHGVAPAQRPVDAVIDVVVEAGRRRSPPRPPPRPPPYCMSLRMTRIGCLRYVTRPPQAVTCVPRVSHWLRGAPYCVPCRMHIISRRGAIRSAGAATPVAAH